MKTFEDFKKEINLADYAIDHGYTFNKASSTKTAIVLNKRNGEIVEETIIVRKNSDPSSASYMQYYYTNPHDSRDKGSITKFISTRLGENDWKKVNEILHRYSGDYIQKTNKETQIEASIPKEHIQNAVEFFDLKPLHSREYLYHRGISDQTIDAPEFSKRILSKAIKSKTGVEHVNVAFPLYNINGLSGVEMKNFKFAKGSAVATDKQHSLWISAFDKNSSIDKIVLGETPIDLISFHQMKAVPGEKVIYAASNCSVTDSQLELMQKLVSTNKPKKIVVAFDNDVSGKLNNIKVAGKICLTAVKNEIDNYTKDNSVTISPSEIGYQVRIEISVHYEDKVEGIEKIARVKEVFDKLNQKQGNNLNEPDEAITYQTIDKQIGDHKGVLEVIFDKNMESLSRVEALIPELRSMNEVLVIAIPASKDFNQDLTESIERKLEKNLKIENERVRGGRKIKGIGF